MTAQAKPSALNMMTFPLHGARLIEASAGTGKTFTIAGLYLRLLLGHGAEGQRHAVPLTVDQILVVTFTEAATAELRDRIRARIHDARLAFARGESRDPVIKPLLEQVTDHAQAASILLQAERQMDEAAVYTIHGFCQRMLTQNAFESGSRFNNEFVTDESHLKSQVVADYWRRHFYPLGLNLAAEVRQIWSSPQALLQDIGRYLTGAPLHLSTPALQTSLDQQHQDNLTQIQTLKDSWKQHSSDFLALISQSNVNKRSYSKKSLPNWLESVDLWAQSETRDYQIPDALQKFAQSVLNDKTPSGDAPTHPVFEQIDQFINQPVSLKNPLMAHAIEECRGMLARAKQQKQWLSFDDLLSQLSAAIDMDQEQQLVNRIRELYPVAMIDEFQDTDPLQYSIFSRVYLDSPQSGLFMIGDPKQAIYAFRGADIFTYIKARNQVVDHYTLDTNWRSSAEMVAAVNQVFEKADSPFIYDDDIPFHPVNASPNADQRFWIIGDQKQPALTYWLPTDAEKPLGKGEYTTVMAKATASQIQHILTSSLQGKAQLCSGEKRQPIEAGDIAVLVRTGSEGRMVKQALAEQGIASVYLSNRDSVFLSPIAQDVQRLLQAVLTPEQDRALRACLASELFALNAQQLDALNNDENAWENAVDEFKEYRKLWIARGVLPMLRSVLSKRHIAERWLAEESERQLTDFIHLGELLQQASTELESDHGLLRWLAQSLSDAQNGLGGSDEEIQRLESERNLVQIVTIHKSKGLEYDLVFLPFVCAYREASEAKYYDPTSDRIVLDLAADSTSLQQADKERLAEDLRLIYVALTRAVYGCYIGLAPIRLGRSSKEPTGVHLSAMGYLLQNGQQGRIADLAASVSKHTEKLDCVDEVEPPTLSDEKYQPPVDSQQALSAKELSGSIDRFWRITSYSGLIKQGHHNEYDASLEIGGFDIDSADEHGEAELVEPQKSIFTFPKGARPGTFLHTVFEQVAFTEPASSPANREILIKLLEQEQLEADWLAVLEALVDTVLSTPLDGQSLCLNQKGPQDKLVEMEFLLPIQVLTSSALNRLVQRHDSLSAKAGDLGFHTVQGMLKGFIDLVFVHQGKYYVLDWKSNHLGDDVKHYHGEALNAAMAEHRYDLQYQIYALALHRFLRSRLADYDYQRHFGGVYYLFLRGIDGQSEHGIFNAKPSEAFLTEMDKLIDGQEVAPQSNANGQMELGL